MVPSSPAKILIGISLDPDETRELLSWAIRVLARPNDTLVAVHILEPSKKHVQLRKEESKLWHSITKYQTTIRRAKAFAISLMAEFVKTCHSKQVYLEARVGFSSSIGRGLIDEVKSTSAEFLIIGSSRNRSNRYCFEHVPDGCSLIVVSKSRSMHIQEFCKSSSRWTAKRSDPVSSVKESGKPSPRTVLDTFEGESQTTEEDNSSFGGSSITKSPPQFKSQSNFRKQPMSPLKLIWSFFSASFDFTERKRNNAFLGKERHQSLLSCFSYEELSNATNSFHPDNMVGHGGYSEVYRGDLDDGRIIAVKRLTKESTNEIKEKEFLVELGIIGHVNHSNTAKLIGFCIENGLYLIFKFYPNGTLSSALHGRNCEPLEWPVRYKIAIGVAKGLHYLHKCCKRRIIHRDIKASNVLLGPDYEPQISDFGLAKWLPNKWTHHAVKPIEGTFGYLAPECFLHGIVDEKTDVFAFGILLLEILTGRRPVDSAKQSLLLWAKPLMESGRIAELADPKLEGKYDMEQLHTVAITASYCVRQSSIWRPSMTEVLEHLTNGHDPELAHSWRIPTFRTEELDDYSMVFGYERPSDIVLEDMI